MELVRERFLAATNFLVGLPGDVPERDDYTVVVPYFGVVGILLGVGSWVIAWLCRWLLSGPAVAIAGALVLVLFWMMLSRGQNLLATPLLARSLRPDVLRVPPGEMDYGALLIFFFVLVLKLAAVWLLLHDGHYAWLILVPLVSTLFAVEAVLSLGLLPTSRDTLEQVLLLFRTLVLVAALPVGLKGLFSALFFLLLFIVLSGWAKRRCQDFREAWVNGGSEFVECAVLWTGVILFT